MDRKIVAIYTRVSTEEQARRGTSIDVQVETLKNHCRSHNYRIYKEYCDKGFSGSNSNRPKLQELLKDAHDKKFDIVVVTKTDRLSRNIRDIVRIVLDYFEKLNIGFKAIDEPFETTTKTGRLFFTLLAGFADFERETIRDRTLSGRQRRAREGKNPGFGLAVGYKIKDGKIIIDEYYGPVIKEIYKLFLEGNTFFKIASILNKRGIKAQKSNKWRDVTINKILKNIRYTGIAKMILGGVSYNIDNLIPQIIDKNTFENALNRRSLPKKLAPTTKPKHLLSGKDLMICRFCGSGLVHVNKQYKNKRDKVYYSTSYYHDNNRTFGIECGKLKSIRTERVEPLVISIVRELYVTKIFQKKLKAIYADYLKTVSEHKEIKELDNDYVGLKKRKGNLLSAIEKGIDMADIKDRLDELKFIMEENRMKRETFLIQTKKTVDIIKRFESITKSYIKKLHTKPIYEIRRLIELFIDKIIIDNDKIEIKWNKELFALLGGKPDKNTFALFPACNMYKPWTVVKGKKIESEMTCVVCKKPLNRKDSYWWEAGKFYCKNCHSIKFS